MLSSTQVLWAISKRAYLGLVSNLILLCGHHHRVIHHDGWDIHIGNDGHPWFHPPQWMDPLREPRPAQHRQHHTAA